MYRCVVIHRNGTSELHEVQPAIHQKLRGLEYKRFVVEFVRDPDKLSSTAPLYCQFTPSSWQTSNAAKQLWGRRSGTIRLFDEDGHLVQDATGDAGTPLRGMPTVPAPPASSADERGVALDAQSPQTGARSITPDDIVLINALARFVEESQSSDIAFGAVPRELVVERVRGLADKLAALLPEAKIAPAE